MIVRGGSDQATGFRLSDAIRVLKNLFHAKRGSADGHAR